MREVAIIGVGMTPFQKKYPKSFSRLGADAVDAAVADAGIDRRKIEAGWVGSAFGGLVAGAYVMSEAGLRGIPVMTVENVCSSSACALREAWMSVASGMYDIAIAVGVDKLSDLGPGTLPLPAQNIEGYAGLVMPGLYASRATRYIHDYGVDPKDFGLIAVKNRRNGALNPYAQFRKPVTLEEVNSSRMIAYPMTLFQCCPTGDGAAAVIVCDAKTARQYTTKPITIAASSLTSGIFTNGYRDFTLPDITVRCSAKVYKMAGIDPKEVDVAEVHDAFSVAEVLYYEALGFAERGKGLEYVKAGYADINGGHTAVSPSGGLIAKGHPVGPTGLAQVTEIVWQLRGECGERQVPDAKVGLTHCTGGGLWGCDHAACTIHVLKR